MFLFFVAGLEDKIKELENVITNLTTSEPGNNDLEVRISQLENDRASTRGDIDYLNASLSDISTGVMQLHEQLYKNETEELDTRLTHIEGI